MAIAFFINVYLILILLDDETLQTWLFNKNVIEYHYCFDKRE